MNRTKMAGACALALGGCLVSEEPLFDSSNAAATPLDAGAYRGCQVDANTTPSDCHDFDISVNAAGLYKIVNIEEGDEDVALVRFKRIGRGLYAFQTRTGSDQPQYLVAASVPDGVSISMIDCSELPESFKAKHVARGDLVVESRSNCVAKTASVVVAAAKAWMRTDEFKSGSRVVYTKKSAS